MGYSIFDEIEAGANSVSMQRSASTRNFSGLVYQARRDFGAYLASAESDTDKADRVDNVLTAMREAGVKDALAVLEALAAEDEDKDSKNKKDSSDDDSDVPDFVDTDPDDDKDRDDSESDKSDKKESSKTADFLPGSSQPTDAAGPTNPVVPRNVPQAAPVAPPVADPNAAIATDPNNPTRVTSSVLPIKPRVAKKI